MAAEEKTKTEDTAASANFKSFSMREMMSQMMNMCCAGEGGFSGCASMMKDMMKQMRDQSPHPQQAPEDEEKKK